MFLIMNLHSNLPLPVQSKWPSNPNIPKYAIILRYLKVSTCLKTFLDFQSIVSDCINHTCLQLYILTCHAVYLILCNFWFPIYSPWDDRQDARCHSTKTTKRRLQWSWGKFTEGKTRNAHHHSINSQAPVWKGFL